MPQLTPKEPAPASRTPLFPEPGSDSTALDRVGRERPDATKRGGETDVFAEDWWSHARPTLELHGNFRVRAEMFYRFSLGRVDLPADSMWPRPPDSPQASLNTEPGRPLCTPEEAGTGASTSFNNAVVCKNNTQAGANLRFRLNPELHISDNLRVISQIDLLDNLVMGSTPSGYSVSPTADGYITNPRSGAEPLGFDAQTTSTPRSGINSLRDSIHVKRAWAEYATPVGELRFGRMPNHWGLGLVNHSGDGYDDDYQSTIDRLQFVAGIKPLELYLSAAWDFPNEGLTSDAIGRSPSQPYDLAQKDDVDQYVFSAARRKSPELTRLALTRGDVILNGGLQLTYRKQLLSTDPSAKPTCTNPGGFPCDATFVRRDAHYWLPDLWLQLLYKNFRFEAEAATIQGKVHNPSNADNGAEEYTLAQWGIVSEIEQKLVENKLHLGLGFGWASGDADVDGLVAPGSGAIGSGASNGNQDTLGQVDGDRTVSTFRFNPAYRVDLILFRNILGRIQGAYYFRPSIGYDFLRDTSGQRLGGSVAAIWSRASQFVQAPGHDRDLGLELNGALYFQSKDGAANDDPNHMGGFYARLEYGILFPMAGMGYTSYQKGNLIAGRSLGDGDISNAQILRLYLGVLF